MGCRSWMQSLPEVVSSQLLSFVYYRVIDDRDISRIFSTQSAMRTRRVQALVLVFLVGFYCQCVRLYRTVPWEDRFIYTTHDPQEVNYTDDVTTTMPNSYSRGATINVISTPEANETCPYSSPLLREYFTGVCAKWPPVCRRHFRIHFWNENVAILIQITRKFVIKFVNDYKEILVQAMACANTR